MVRYRDTSNLNRPLRALDTGVVMLERANGTEPEAAQGRPERNSSSKPGCFQHFGQGTGFL
jgi:hypothetical protein